jgi:hypothetical protein
MALLIEFDHQRPVGTTPSCGRFPTANHYGKICSASIIYNIFIRTTIRGWPINS